MVRRSKSWVLHTYKSFNDFLNVLMCCLSWYAKHRNGSFLVQPCIADADRHTRGAYWLHCKRSETSTFRAHATRMCQLNDTRCSISLGNRRPLLPLRQNRGFQRFPIHDNIAWDRKKSDINLDLSCDEKSVSCSRPRAVQLTKFIDGRVETIHLRQRTLHVL